MSAVRVPLDWPNLGEAEKRYVTAALESGYVSSAGPLVREFEERFAAYLGVRFAVSTVNGTAALNLALRILDIGPDDEVIVPALTFVATVNPVLYVGASPLVVDVDPQTWNLDPKAVARAITARTKAIIPVHLYGNPVDMEPLMRQAKDHNLYVIEDATEALGATYGGRMAGTLGDVGVFSFNGNKIITTGGGGMLVTNNPHLARRARILVNQGRDPEETEYSHEEIGYNYKLTNLQAALGLAQLERLPEFLATKRRNATIYRRELGGIEGLCWQQETPGAESNWWLFSVWLDERRFGEDRRSVMGRLGRHGVQVRPLFKPIPEQPCYVGFSFPSCPVANRIYEGGLSLPSASFLTPEEVAYVCSVLKLRI
ncbi:MAG: LegC family aminotransferase [Clostridia bacterium]|jgi:perosamine synthetase|nr:LegC family aminotransferase [Clostridia bacterium]